jgi:hypothetical protein
MLMSSLQSRQLLIERKKGRKEGRKEGRKKEMKEGRKKEK